ncbi:hypothetical protein CAEBREN_19787 [Caenorhabditis brenneri]|uniref:Uncharacterized protein n=1 Tax=Caenorhabditis brenneri TaxID=135651 RepID=G0N6X3_CAEBE|nr:hypothetical protein CAEBREN_19787 [Caenorhabditis brenneri]
MEEYTPLILDEFFIKNCIQYEYLKNPESPRQAFKNISEMLISDIVRSDVQWRGDGIRLTPEPDLPPPEYFEPGPLFPKPDPESSDDTPVTNIDDYEDEDEVKKKEEPRPDHQNADDDEEDVQPGKRRTVVVDSIDSARTSIETTSPRSIFDELIKPDDIDVDSDDSMIEFPIGSSYTLWKEDEEDCWMNGIPLGLILAWYAKVPEWCGFDEWPSKRRHKVLLSELRMWAFNFFRLNFTQPSETGPLQQPFNEVKVVIDHSKIKIILSDSTKNAKNLKFEYWEGEKGSIVWYNDSVRFIEGFHYETLAANEFLHIANWALSFEFLKPMINLEKLEFDIEDHHKWSPPHYPSPDFYRKIKRFILNLEKKEGMPAHFLYVKHYSFKLYRFKKWNHLMIPLKFLSPNCIEEITIKIWDDSHLKRSKRRYTKYLDYQNFKEVKMWNVTPEVLEKMKKMFSKRIPKPKVISVKTGYTKELKKFGILEK